MKKFSIFLAAIFTTVLLVGCDSRECLRGHTEMMMMPQAGVGMNGQPTTTIVPTYVYVCDEYAPEVVER
jgi:hypothetical protein